jgi:AraC-like DNA-binding protein/mannose-6-phosphate isomerase-like protein (cupin superfamily)
MTFSKSIRRMKYKEWIVMNAESQITNIKKTAIKYDYAPVSEDILFSHRTTNYNVTFPYHRHDGYEVYLFLSGNVHSYIEQECYPLKRGDLVTFHPKEMHRVVCLSEQPYERISINVKVPLVKKLSTSITDLRACFENRSLGKNNVTHLTNQEINSFILLSHKLRDALQAPAYGSDVLCNIYLSELLLLVNQAFQKTPVYTKNIMPTIIAETMSYIDEHLCEEISLDKLSSEFYTNGTYISRQFKKHTGLTLRDYILDKRISLARMQLASGKSVTEACYLSGFSDYANFIRSFKKQIGVTPGKYYSSTACK